MSPRGEREAQRGGVLRVLVVDDEEFIRSVLTEILEAEGYEVVGASDGEAALEQLHGERFDLVITDLVMPGVSGMEVLAAAKRVDPNLPVVVMTGYPSSSTVAELTAMELDEFITKPFDIEMVKRLVARLTKGGRQSN